MAKYDVFLSYSRADTERVAPLRDELRRLGYEVFFDVQSIDPGEQWKRRLERSIAASRTIVLCWSENTRGSEYITFEYSRGEALHKPILPWLLDKTPLPAMLEVQGITTADPAQAAAQLKPALGWPLGGQAQIAGRAGSARGRFLRALRVWWFALAPATAVAIQHAGYRPCHRGPRCGCRSRCPDRPGQDEHMLSPEATARAPSNCHSPSRRRFTFPCVRMATNATRRWCPPT